MLNSSNTIQIDNGSQNIRTQLGHSTQNFLNTKMINKDTGQTHLIDTLDVDDEAMCKVINPCTRGLVTKLDHQTSLWERIFQLYQVSINSQNEHNLIITLQIATPIDIVDKIIQVFLEYYYFNNVCIMNPQFCLAQQLDSPYQLLIDSSHSATYLLPIINHNLSNQCYRLDVGGKLITNYFKQIISYKYLDLSQLFYHTQHIKHSLLAAEGHAPAYVFGDTIATGYIEHDFQQLQQIPPSNKIMFQNEREFLKNIFFCPQNIGIKQAGLHLAIKELVNKMPQELHSSFYNNIQLAGGNFNIQGLQHTLQDKLTQELPQNTQITLCDSMQSILLFIQQGSI